MNISEFCIRRPVFTILLMAAIVVGGVAGYQTLAISALPKVDFPTISVTASLPGANPETMASSVATPLERAFSTIAGISSMTSRSYLGTASITLQFDLDRDIDGAALDVQTAISSTLRSLPKEMLTPPSFRKVNPADQPILNIAVSSDILPTSKINEYADVIMSRRISTIAGVAQVSIYGSQKYAVRVRLDPAKMATQGLGFEDIRQSLSSAASNSPVGVISGDKQLFNIKVAGQPDNAEKFRELVVVWKNGTPVRLKDVALVTDDIEDNRSIAFIDGRQSVVLAVQRQPDANTVEVVNKIYELLPSFKSQIPASVEITPMFDRSISVKNSIHDVQFTLFITIALVIAVIFLFLHNIRMTIIPALAVPLSIITTYGGMALFGFSINNISLLAITLCVGFVVDDAIVMLENIVRYVEGGMKPFDAALKGSKEIGFTIISITFSLVAVFIPVLFMGGIIGRMFHEFAVTISFAILVSGFVSLTLTPMLCSRLIKPSKREKYKEGSVELKLEKGFNSMLNFYEKTLKWCFHHKSKILIFTIITLFTSIGLFVYSPKGFFPIEDTGFVSAQTEASQDISFEAMLEKQKKVAAVIRANPAVDHVFYSIGGGRGSMNSGSLSFSLKPRNERPPVEVIIAGLRNEVMKKVEGIGIFMQPVQNIQIGGRVSKSLYQYTLQGANLDDLYLWSDKLLQELIKTEGFVDVTSDLQLKSLQASVELDQDKAASFGINYDNLHQILYNAFGVARVASIYTSSNDYGVIMEVDRNSQKLPEDIGKLYVHGSGGKMIPLDAIIKINRSIASLSVNHQGQMPAVTISFNLNPGIPLSYATNKVEEASRKIGIPDSIIGSFQGSAQVFKDSNAGQGMLILLTIIVIYIILGMLYESFIHPITILSGLPSAAIGAILALLLFKMDLNIIALVGIILLIGIVKKNAIMMVDFAITAKHKGKSAEEAIFEACMLRFRPIMMTTMAAIFGTLPIAFAFGNGAELRQPLGIVVVGGLLVSQVLTLYITPVIYLYLEKLAEKFK